MKIFILKINNNRVIILYFSRITNYVKENLFECILFLLLIISVSLITYYRFKVQLEIGPVWDAYDFLANSAEFAGKSINYTDPMRPPLLSFFTSIFFRYDGLYEGAIFIVDGILFTLGALGLYFLFKFRFEPIYSFIGVLMYVTSPLILSLICGGWSDVSSCSFLILGIYFLILSVKKDSRFFYLTFPLFMMAFLSRYASALIIFPILLYLLIELKNIKRYQNVLVGALISFLVLLPVLIFFQLKFGNFLYPFIDSFGTSKGSDVTLWFAYNPDKLFFFKNMPYYMGSTAIAVFFISLLGCAVILLRKIDMISKKVKKIGSNRLNSDLKIKIAFFIILTILLIFSFEIIHYMISILIFTLLCYVFYQIVKVKGEYNHLSQDLLLLAWIGTFLIFNSAYAAKVDRYFVMMVPPICYFLLMGLKITIDQVGVKYKNINASQCIFSFFLIIIMLTTTFSYIQEIPKENSDSITLRGDVISASQWLKEYDPSYKDKIICADFWQYFGWYLQTDIKKMPIFRNNQIIYSESKDHNFTYEDNIAFNNELETNNAYYYLCSHPQLNITNYKLIRRFGVIGVYEKLV